MKYMGSKKNMILNGLGDTFHNEIKDQVRVIDLMSGSASEAWFVAQHFPINVIAVDLQKYSQILANSVLKRTKGISSITLWIKWFENYKSIITNHPLYEEALKLENKNLIISCLSTETQKLCSSQTGGIIWNSYGGFYFSALQALKLDILLESIPFNKPNKYVAQAAIISAASQCSASPGHTAQPFKPNETAGIFLKEAWMRDPVYYTERAFKSIGNKYSKVIGDAFVTDAFDFIPQLTKGDLVFVDPPYSGVHYSRFYHVLETIARGNVGNINGIGRYPPQKERPVSVFSRKSESEIHFQKLIKLISEKGSKVIITYPDRDCSNGLSGKRVIEICSDYFNIEKKVVTSNFSTLGGNNKIRSAREKTGEMILVLKN